jgi:hypothetical protein
MVQLSRVQFAPIAGRCGAKVPGLKEEPEAKMEGDLAAVPRTSAPRIVTESLHR